MKKIVFNCNQTHKQGFGHFFRCLNLAKHLLSYGSFNVSFMGKFSVFSESILTQNKIHIIGVTSDSEILNHISSFDFLVVDRYDLKQDFIEKLTCYKKTKRIYIDDFNTLDFSDQDLIINFRVGVETFSYASNHTALGKDFFIYDPKLSYVREQYTFKSQLNNVLFFGSGTKQTNSLFKNLPKYLLNEFPQLKITHITSTPEPISNPRYCPVEVSTQIEEKLLEADAIINGGGLIKYEAAFCGIPGATLSTTDEQHEDTLILARKELLYNLGNQNKMNQNLLEEKVTNFIKNEDLRFKIHQNGKTYFKPNSVNNLIQKINEL